MANLAAGGQGNNFMAECVPRPACRGPLTDYEGMEFFVTPATTYIRLVEPVSHVRRIYTDGRDWPKNAAPTLLGYSIGTWRDESGASSRYDVLAGGRDPQFSRPARTVGIERACSCTSDNQSIIKERIYVDGSDPVYIAHDQITTIDHALDASTGR